MMVVVLQMMMVMVVVVAMIAMMVLVVMVVAAVVVVVVVVVVITVIEQCFLLCTVHTSPGGASIVKEPKASFCISACRQHSSLCCLACFSALSIC
jgi:hypothetical protein